MAWSKSQVSLAHIVQSQLHWDRGRYEMVCRNVAGIRPFGGKISSLNPSATNAAFARFMAFAETEGFIDTKNGEGYWSKQAHDETQRVHHKIRALHDRAVVAGLVSVDSLPAFIERQTHKREDGATQLLEDCDATWSSKILEGLKAWLFPEARKRGITLEM
jgi:hypothetical protein